MDAKMAKLLARLLKVQRRRGFVMPIAAVLALLLPAGKAA